MVHQKHASVKIGNICNNRCIGCDISAGENIFIVSTEKVKKELFQLKKLGFKSVELIGGEITIQKNFLELFKLTSSMFPEVTLATNGRMFAYEGFLKKIISYLPSKFNLEIAIHGHNAQVHELFTGTPDSFGQMIAGIKNIIKYKKYFNNLGINTVVLKSNYIHLGEILNLILSFKVFKSWYIISFVPTEGRALKNINILMPKYKDLLILNKILLRAYSNFEVIDLDGFPYCLFHSYILNNKNDKIHIINSDIIEIEKKKKVIRNFNATFSFNKFNYFSNISAFPKLKKLKLLHDSFRIKLSPCERCFYNSLCRGIWREYVNIFGSDNSEREIKLLKKKNLGALWKN